MSIKKEEEKEYKENLGKLAVSEELERKTKEEKSGSENSEEKKEEGKLSHSLEEKAINNSKLSNRDTDNANESKEKGSPTNGNLNSTNQVNSTNPSQSNNIFCLPETSPAKYPFNSSSLLISPVVENKFNSNSGNIMMTPVTGKKSGGGLISSGSTPYIPFDLREIREMKLDSPFQEINGLRHNERSSSFKRIRINNFPNEICGRNINFENNMNGSIYSHNIYNSLGGVGSISNTSNMNSSLFNSKVTSMKNSNSISSLNKLSMRSSFNRKMNFSSESDIESQEEEDSKNTDSEKSSSHAEESKVSNKKKRKTSQTKKNFCCTCTKSRCLKKYCECYANKEYCDGCECQNCYNLPKFREMIKRSLDFTGGKGSKYHAHSGAGIDEDSIHSPTESLENQEIVCNCTKSNCMKKYCECFKAGEGCKDSCRCINCENDKQVVAKHEGGIGGTITNKVNFVLSEAEKEKRKFARNPINFIIEGTSVYIYNEDISITQRKEIPVKKEFIKKNNENNPLIKTEENESKNGDNLTNLSSNNISGKKKGIFQVNPDNNTALYKTETPKVINKKRKRVNSGAASSQLKSNSACGSTHFHTPIFTTTNSEKSQPGDKKKVEVEIDNNIVKNLDKIY